MGEVIQLFPSLPSDLKEGDLVWLPRFAALGTIMAVNRAGQVEITTQGGTITLHVVRNRHEIHTSSEAAFMQTTADRA
jgi:uncharacterized protein (DUF1684 family)